MNRVEVNERAFDLKSAITGRESFRGSKRRVFTLTVVNTSYEDIKGSFVDGASWKIIDSDGREYDWSDFNLAGQIIDMRDGSFVVKMAEKLSEIETLESDISLLKENLKTISGIDSGSSEDYISLRESVESLYQQSDINDDSRIRLKSLCPLWSKGKHIRNEIYKTEHGVNVSSSEMAQVWECFQDYDNTVYPDITPDNPSWRTFNRPLHGTSPETAMPWAKPTNATDQYNIGEYMVYIDNIVYKCIQSTNFSPEEYGEAWEKQVFD